MSLPTTIHAWAAAERNAPLTRIEKKIPELQRGEILIKVLSCGVCHSDIHLIDNDWRTSRYPLVPGHEILGEVVSTYSQSSRLKPGQIVGVGWQRSACGDCLCCITGRDNMCDKKSRTCVDGWGGYADFHIADERFTFEIPEGCESPAFAPLLCAGITVYSPLCELLSLKQLGAPRVGIVAVGGLGHLAVKFAAHLGCEVTVFSSSSAKEKEAKEMGATYFVNSRDPKAVAAYGPRLDLVLVTANVDLPWENYLQTLRPDGTLCFVGIPPSNITFNIAHLLDTRRKITASPIGNRSRMYDMLEFAQRHRIEATVEKFPLERVNEAIDRVRKNDLRYRAVLSTS